MMQKNDVNIENKMYNDPRGVFICEHKEKYVECNKLGFDYLVDHQEFQEKWCNNACVERFLKAKGDNVKKTAKQLRNCLAWRDSIGIDTLIADEFSAELADGVAYVAGHDDELRPVMIFRIKQDYQKFHSQKLFIRLLVFTLEVAIQTMAKNVEQFVLLFDARIARRAPEVSRSGFFRSAPAFMNMLLATLKIIADYYPGRLHKAFVIDPPSLFSYLWKGVRPFVELSPLTMVVSSIDFEESLEFNDFMSYPRAASLRFDTSSVISSSSAKLGSCSSSRFSFTVSHHFDSLKPWYLSLTDDRQRRWGPQTLRTPCWAPPSRPSMPGPTLFASPVARGAPRGSNNLDFRKSFFPSTPMPQKDPKLDPSMIHHPRTPKPSFLQIRQTLFFRRDSHQVEDEASSRWPHLDRSPQLRRRHMSVSQRF
ncbi:hypothetical protein DH2020_049040 [Rehmannia glutinosa]|uniref:CRAL-TRIO domain-containing protein n=1 Tax=Rehmannia glutinosa TaxID=99300 RepID=A0ABR0U4N5_REHGL